MFGHNTAKYMLALPLSMGVCIGFLGGFLPWKNNTGSYLFLDRTEKLD